MNRKQRRAAHKQPPPAGIHPPPAAVADAADELYAQAVWHEDAGKLAEAARLYKRVLTLMPDHAAARSSLGFVYLDQGKLAKASLQFAQAITLNPQSLTQFTEVNQTLNAVNPAIAQAGKRAADAWPRRLPLPELLGASGIAAIAADPLLCAVLQSTTIRDVDLERALTCVRLAVVQIAMDAAARDRIEDSVLGFCGALAKQCFINEYVFATAPEESEQAERLKATLVDLLARDLAGDLARNLAVSPLLLIAVAMYFPLDSLPGAPALLDRSWPAPVVELLTQQLREPWQERRLRDSIPRLTTIEDAVSARVRQQYEENPYPRWVHAALSRQPTTIDEYLRRQFPSTPFRALGKANDVDILVAGCGTGRLPIELAQSYLGARLLAVDLSLASLCCAKRKTPPHLAGQIEYAQADILKLGSIGRTFDLISAGGVLHHMSDPLAGWRELLKLLRPGGFMSIGLYSEFARHDVVAARAFIAANAYRPTPDDIRRCRQELLNSAMKNIAKFNDFFSTSECRDLLFHVHERRLSIAEIKAFVGAHELKFIGFEFTPPAAHEHYRSVFAGAGWSTADLDRWHAYESENPATFAGMYHFWVQKN